MQALPQLFWVTAKASQQSISLKDKEGHLPGMLQSDLTKTA